MTGLIDDLNIRVEKHVPLGPRTWYRVGGEAELLAHPSSIAQLSALVARCRDRGVPIHVLGSGANLLVRDGGVPGMSVSLDDPGFSRMRMEGETVIAGGGYDLFKLVRETARAGLGGLEHVAGIPASVGGAVRMNAGGAYGEIGSSVRRVQVLSATGQVYYRNRDDLVFSYRHANIDAPFILEVEFEMARRDPMDLMRQVKEIFFYKKNTQPMGEPTAGCVFKNPPPHTILSRKTEADSPTSTGELSQTQPMSATAALATGGEADVQPATAQLAVPETPGEPITAAKLIDRAGLKGHRHGSAYVSHIHANFIAVERQGGRADDVWALIEEVEQMVLETFGIQLERELIVWP